MKKIFFLPDLHAPYHDKRAFHLALKALRTFKPDVIFVLGDFVDFYAVSAHSRDPRRRRDLGYEVEVAKECLDEVSAAAGGAQKIFCEGNHEYRLERYIRDHAPELVDLAVGAGTLSISSLLGLAENGWDFLPYGKMYHMGHLYVSHDVGYCGVNAARQSLALVQGNYVFGHTHQIAYLIEGSAKGKAHAVLNCGWLGDASHIDYAPTARVARFWAHGFGIGYMLLDGTVHLQPVPIVNGRVIIEGREIRL